MEDGQAELTWVTGYIPRVWALPTPSWSPIQVLTWQCMATRSQTCNLLFALTTTPPSHGKQYQLGKRMFTVAENHWGLWHTRDRVDLELVVTGRWSDRVDRIEEMLILVMVDSGQCQYLSARCNSFTHVNHIQRLTKRWRVVVDVQHYHSHLI